MPEALLFALAGAAAGGFHATAWVFLGVAALAVGLGLIGWKRRGKQQAKAVQTSNLK